MVVDRVSKVEAQIVDLQRQIDRISVDVKERHEDNVEHLNKLSDGQDAMRMQLAAIGGGTAVVRFVIHALWMFAGAVGATILSFFKPHS